MLLKIGDKASLTKDIGEQDVIDFARLSLDGNPLHLDEEYARQTRFGRRIVHGMSAAWSPSRATSSGSQAHAGRIISRFDAFSCPAITGDSPVFVPLHSADARAPVSITILWLVLALASSLAWAHIPGRAVRARVHICRQARPAPHSWSPV